MFHEYNHNKYTYIKLFTFVGGIYSGMLLTTSTNIHTYTMYCRKIHDLYGILKLVRMGRVHISSHIEVIYKSLENHSLRYQVEQSLHQFYVNIKIDIR